MRLVQPGAMNRSIPYCTHMFRDSLLPFFLGQRCAVIAAFVFCGLSARETVHAGLEKHPTCSGSSAASEMMEALDSWVCVVAIRVSVSLPPIAASQHWK